METIDHGAAGMDGRPSLVVPTTTRSSIHDRDRQSAVYDFEVDGKKYSLVNVGEAGVFDGARAAKDLETIVKEDRRLWGFPRTTDVFFNMITESGGGLEHRTRPS